MNNEQQKRQSAPASQGDHLEDRVNAGQPLDDRIHTGKGGNTHHHQQYAGKRPVGVYAAGNQVPGSLLLAVYNRMKPIVYRGRGRRLPGICVKVSAPLQSLRFSFLQ